MKICMCFGANAADKLAKVQSNEPVYERHFSTQRDFKIEAMGSFYYPVNFEPSVDR